MITNFFKIEFSFTEFNVQRVDYSEERLNSLRRTHNANASFFRNGDHIYISPRKGAGLSIGENVRLPVEGNVRIVEQLIRHLIFRVFRDAFPDRLPEGFAPLRFPSKLEKHDLLAPLVPKNLQGLITYSPVNEVHVRSVVENGRTIFGILPQSHRRWRFSSTLAQLHKEGFSFLGATVLRTVPIPGLSGILAPDESVVGEIERVDGEFGIVLTNQESERLPLEELYLQRNREQIGKYLAFRLGDAKATTIFEKLREKHKEHGTQSVLFGETVSIAGWFARQTYENDDGFTFSITRNSTLGNNGIKLEPTRLVFDYGPGASDSKPFAGLMKYGPFDSSKFDRKQPRFLAIFHERNRGAATQFLAQLIDGIPNSAYFKSGLRDLFRLHDINYTLKEIRGQFPENYEQAIDEAVKESGTNRFDLALVECADGSRTFPITHNPYYRAKARLMSFGIPVQCVKESHLRRNSQQLGYTLGPVALQVYAKLGGIPWLLPGSQSVDAELVVGIGNTIHRPNLWSGAEQSRVVGLTTFFLGDGRYIMGQELKSVPYKDYFAELLRSLEESLTYVSQEYGWKDGKTVRMVFHVFKPLKNIEIDAISELVKRFSRYSIRFAFVTVSTLHPWMMFGDTNTGQDGKWNVTLCERGANLILDNHSCLLQSRGEKDRPNKQHRPPFPELVRIHEKSTYTDLPFITQQVLDFSYLCWRSFFPTEIPVTILYSNLMADLSMRLQQIKTWNPTFLDQHFRRKAWFL
jgi:hypothetical protein